MGCFERTTDKRHRSALMPAWHLKCVKDFRLGPPFFKNLKIGLLASFIWFLVLIFFNCTVIENCIWYLDFLWIILYFTYLDNPVLPKSLSHWVMKNKWQFWKAPRIQIIICIHPKIISLRSLFLLCVRTSYEFFHPFFSPLFMELMILVKKRFSVGLYEN